MVEPKSEVTSSSGESPALCSTTVFALGRKWNRDSSAAQYKKKKKGHTIFEVFTSELLEMKLQPLFTWDKVLVTLLVLGLILLLKRI